MEPAQGLRAMGCKSINTTSSNTTTLCTASMASLPQVMDPCGPAPPEWSWVHTLEGLDNDVLRLLLVFLADLLSGYLSGAGSLAAEVDFLGPMGGKSRPACAKSPAAVSVDNATHSRECPV